ncbi:hypothetical protein CsSME_00038033 [Camellia sinensis var. sinensis]
MANYLTALLSESKVAAFCCHYFIPEDVQIELVADMVVDMEMTNTDTIVFLLLAIDEGEERFPLHLFLRTILHYWGLIPS